MRAMGLKVKMPNTFLFFSLFNIAVM
jgi:hypothetical protein